MTKLEQELFNKFQQVNEESLEELRTLNKLIKELEGLRDRIYITQAETAKMCGHLEEVVKQEEDEKEGK